MENIIVCLNNVMTHHIKEAYADKAYDSKSIRQYLRKHQIKDMIPRRQYNRMCQDNCEQNSYNRTRYVVERFFAWLKCGFRRIVIKYERKTGNYESLINIASFLMYCRVLG